MKLSSKSQNQTMSSKNAAPKKHQSAGAWDNYTKAQINTVLKEANIVNGPTRLMSHVRANRIRARSANSKSPQTKIPNSKIQLKQRKSAGPWDNLSNTQINAIAKQAGVVNGPVRPRAIILAYEMKSSHNIQAARSDLIQASLKSKRDQRTPKKTQGPLSASSQESIRSFLSDPYSGYNKQQVHSIMRDAGVIEARPKAQTQLLSPSRTGYSKIHPTSPSAPKQAYAIQKYQLAQINVKSRAASPGPKSAPSLTTNPKKWRSGPWDFMPFSIIAKIIEDAALIDCDPMTRPASAPVNRSSNVPWASPVRNGFPAQSTISNREEWDSEVDGIVRLSEAMSPRYKFQIRNGKAVTEFEKSSPFIAMMPKQTPKSTASQNTKQAGGHSSGSKNTKQSAGPGSSASQKKSKSPHTPQKNAKSSKSML